MTKHTVTKPSNNNILLFSRRSIILMIKNRWGGGFALRGGGQNMGLLRCELDSSRAGAKGHWHACQLS
eukprot:4941314-Amphidinium_carterae.3